MFAITKTIIEFGKPKTNTLINKYASIDAGVNHARHLAEHYLKAHKICAIEINSVVNYKERKATIKINTDDTTAKAELIFVVHSDEIVCL